MRDRSTYMFPFWAVLRPFTAYDYYSAYLLLSSLEFAARRDKKWLCRRPHWNAQSMQSILW